MYAQHVHDKPPTPHLGLNTLQRQNRQFNGTGAVSPENRAQGFRPAFMDTRTGISISRVSAMAWRQFICLMACGQIRLCGAWLRSRRGSARLDHGGILEPRASQSRMRLSASSHTVQTRSGGGSRGRACLAC